MPSINRTIQIHARRRIRLNTCEGYVGISDETTSHGSRWDKTAQINLTREQAAELIAQLSDQMAKHF